MAESTGGRRRWIGYLGTGLVGLIAGSALGVAHADFGGAGGGFGGGHRFFMRHGARGPQEMGEHAQFVVDMAFRAAGASEEQREQGKAIVEKHLAAAQALRDKHEENRQVAVAALTGERVDRDKLESVRQAQMQLADRASKELTATLAELAEVLTPEQRSQVLEMAQRFHR